MLFRIKMNPCRQMRPTESFAGIPRWHGDDLLDKDVCIIQCLSLNLLHTWMHVHILYALYVSVHKY